jgi:hypothetical protein
MENREANAQRHNAEGFAPVERLPYCCPTLVEYGDVSKLTRSGGSEALKDAFASTRMHPPG